MLLPGLSAKREVIAFELQGHGHTADIDRPLSYEAMAGDIGAALEALHILSAVARSAWRVLAATLGNTLQKAS